MCVDFLVVGAGLFGAVFARLATDHGYRCIVLEQRDHTGGNCHTEVREGIDVHLYGPHIVHTSNETVWQFLNRHTTVTPFINMPKAYRDGRLYSLPFCLSTFHELWGVTSPDEARQIIEAQRWRGHPTNLEEQALSLVGEDIYRLLIRDYTEKQWGRPATELPPFIIRRLPISFRFNASYYPDTYQGIPDYPALFRSLLNGIDVRLGVDYLQDRWYWNTQARQVVFTGPIDQFFDGCFGALEYRSLDFRHQVIETTNYQGNAVINFPSREVPFTRRIEHRHFAIGNRSPVTVVTEETPKDCAPGDVPYYPINTEQNNRLHRRYMDLAATSGAIFGGRLAEYRYIDMNVVIESAMNRWKSWLRASGRHPPSATPQPN